MGIEKRKKGLTETPGGLNPDVTGAFAPAATSRPSQRPRRETRLDAELPAYVFLQPGGFGLGPTSKGRVRSSDRRGRDGSRPEADLPALGSILDKYRIEELLGRGGFGVVYRATHLLLQTPVAIKLLRPKITQKEPMFARLLCEEARFAARIDHPNVVRVQDVTDTPEITYVVMEYIDGATLARIIEKEGPLDPARVIRIAIDIASGLRAGHEQSLIHRDIKPANVLIAKSGIAKIVDLGLAIPRDNDESISSPISSRVTRRMPVVGTPAYMSPEQTLAPEDVDFRTDIYSLGVTMFHAATGQLPFFSRDPARCMEMHRTQRVPRVESVNPAVPGALADLIFEMMAKNANARPASYKSLIDRLTATLKTLAPDH